jgi:hypothetical protein
MYQFELGEYQDTELDKKLYEAFMSQEPYILSLKYLKNKIYKKGNKRNEELPY